MASIKERSPGHFQITVSCGSHINGRKRTETTTFIASSGLTAAQQLKEAKAYAVKFEEKIHSSTSLDARHLTFEGFSEKWLCEYASIHLAPKTIEKYTQELKNIINPIIGKKKLSDIRPALLNSFFVSLTKDGTRKDGKPGGYSKASIAKTKNVVSSVLSTAVEWELLEKNPCAHVRLPTVKKMADTIKFFTQEQTTHFLDFIEQPYLVHITGHDRVDDTGKSYHVDDYDIERSLPLQFVVLFQLAIYGGLRKGELLALKFSDFDYKENTVTISKSVTTVKGKKICKEPKTRSSLRTITIPAALMAKVSALKKEKDEAKAFWDEDWAGEDWLFTMPNGSMMDYNTPYHTFEKTIERYNASHTAEDQLPKIPFHGLRHTSATLLISANQDIATVSKRLGHAHASVTLDIFTHALASSDHAASDALENMLKNEY